MRKPDKGLLQQVSDEVAALCADMIQMESVLLKRTSSLHDANRPSARNLAHYMALRRHDIRKLQSQLAGLGLSSLGRTESHVLDAFQTVHQVLTELLGSGASSAFSDMDTLDMVEGAELLERHTETLLGPPPPGRTVRIMVTMDTGAATEYELVRDLVQSGMDCMRINCAHDNPELWQGMIRNLQRAREETGRNCRVLMDLPGPKLRTGAVEPGPAVVKVRPERDELGHVVAAARVWLACGENAEPPAAADAAVLPLPAEFAAKLRSGDVLHFRDARNSKRSLRVTHADSDGAWAELQQTTYFVPGIVLEQRRRKSPRVKLSPAFGKGRIGELPHLPQSLLLKPGDTLLLTRESAPGRAACYDKSGELIQPAQISVSLPEILDHAKVGDPVWFDDGKIGGVVRAVNKNSVTVEISQARAQGEKLGAGKGINLPETQIDLPALTEEDSAALPFIVEHADLVGCSFVRTDTDVRRLLERIEHLGGQNLGLVLKIETRKGFENLPNLILTAMRTKSVGIMIARGDLAVECGYQRLAEIQEEILWICEAAHVPVIWATQVLESLAKKGIPSRSEITDAAMGERAECVMLNKGPFATTAVRVLADILRRMQSHQEKKRSMLRQLRLAASFSSD